MEMDKSCGDGTCVTDTQKHLGRGASCSKPEISTTSSHELDVASCDFTQEAGQKCSILIKEGDWLCDKHCNNLVRRFAL